MPRLRSVWLLAVVFLAVAGGTVSARWASACPFCAAVSLTFSEEVAGSDVAVIAKLVDLPAATQDGGDGKARFEILDVLKGKQALGKARHLEALYFGNNPVGTIFLVLGVEPPAISWSTPIALGERGRAYLAKALAAPKEGADRLAFFQDYLEDRDEMLARDAYDEFAKTPYAGVKELGKRMHHDKVVAWVQDPQIAPSRRRLYLTMLGVCGTPDDTTLLEGMIRSGDRQTKTGLDALLAAYLTLKGPDGMPLVEDLFLKKKDADYTDTYAAIMALRFHGQEEKIVPRERLLEGLRYMLDRPQLADLVIPDLGRWHDWSVMDRLVDLFKNADDESSWVRVPVINYLRACPLPKAKMWIEELTKLDPESVKKANSFFPLSNPAPAAAADSAQPASDDKKPAAPAAGAAPAGSPTPAGNAAPAGKKLSSAAAPSLAPQRTVEAHKPVVAAPKTPPSGAKSAQTAALRTARLSRAAAAAPDKLSRIGALPVLGWMCLAGGVLAVFLLAILRGGQESAS